MFRQVAHTPVIHIVIRPVLAYASLAFYNFFLDTSKSKLEQVQDSATKIIEPDLEYPARLKFLSCLLFVIFLLVLRASASGNCIYTPSTVHQSAGLRA